MGKGAYQGGKPGGKPAVPGAPRGDGGQPFRTGGSRDGQAAPFHGERGPRSDDAAGKPYVRGERAPRHDDGAGKPPFRGERGPRNDDSAGKPFVRGERGPRIDDGAGKPFSRGERGPRSDDSVGKPPFRGERGPRHDDASGKPPFRSERAPRSSDDAPFRTERFNRSDDGAKGHFRERFPRPDGGDGKPASSPRRDDVAGQAPYRGAAVKAQPPRTPSPAAAPVARADRNEDGLRPSYHRDFKTAPQTSFKADVKPDSLAFALLGAAAAVVRVREGMALPQALAIVFNDTQATPQARGAIQDIAYRAMRKLGWSDALVGIMAPKAPEPMVGALLACALPLMVKDDDGEAAYSQFTVVDQTVTAASSHPDTARAKAMMNAVLRRFQRERKELLEAIEQQPVAKWNYPQWWIDAVITAYPKDWQAILATGNQAPPLTLRVNARRTTVADYLKTLEQAGIAATQVGKYAVRLAKPVGVQHIPGFADGIVSVQDAGAQLAAGLLDVQNGMRVLDACAAPGGKTCHILELADVSMTALDADPKRLDRVGENLQRLGFSAQLQVAEAQHDNWWDGQQFDRIVADVPCTASGIVRRHPDIRWLRRKSDTLQLATLSREILDNLWKMLAPNGKLLFVTCSLWPQESEAQAAAFAVRNGATRLDAPGQLLPTGSVEQDHDGLYYALFQKDA
ncbi:16S rRNA (cytosine(967)-C(5))-methyltransferase RsmB [Duganella ginsengisoli]|uniref:16S rRNA (Cytosine(967)-C(5))-methyltransferase RsmB n=1 Tax=Pseudoduganella ginsengisoli TaxID=1462440 RepID=A0A6L6PYM6_9BURK|nr:16S rRNA (cytosine(967)-C(5))-methyltransferase RsmB [Pseudoduganella ginsengisoli]